MCQDACLHARWLFVWLGFYAILESLCPHIEQVFVVMFPRYEYVLTADRPLWLAGGS